MNRFVAFTIRMPVPVSEKINRYCQEHYPLSKNGFFVKIAEEFFNKFEKEDIENINFQLEILTQAIEDIKNERNQIND